VSPSAWDFGIEAAGKPFLHDAGLSFNLSHTRGLVGCAIGEGAPLGLDVESTNRLLDMESIAGCFSPGETAALDRCDDDTRRLRLLELWTLKESFVKALGTGLAMPLDSMSFELDRQGSIVFEPPPGVAAREWHFALFEPAPDARMAVAVRAPHPPVVIARGVSPTDVDVTSIPLPPMRLTATLTTRPPATGGSPRTI
jgi:4'-phosphopantetheinyl transferase